eukprot:gene32259-16824_t
MAMAAGRKQVRGGRDAQAQAQQLVEKRQRQVSWKPVTPAIHSRAGAGHVNVTLSLVSPARCSCPSPMVPTTFSSARMSLLALTLEATLVAGAKERPCCENCKDEADLQAQIDCGVDCDVDCIPDSLAPALSGTDLEQRIGEINYTDAEWQKKLVLASCKINYTDTDRQKKLVLASCKINYTDAEWQKKLDPASYMVLRQGSTETPFTSSLDNEKREGLFSCKGCGNGLFTSDMKYDSGTG